MSELFEIGVGTVNHHLKAIFSEKELDAEATIRRYRIVQSEGARTISRDVEHYSLPAVLAVGYRVRNSRGTQFRQWATERLNEYLVKGFVMDDERLRNPPGPGHQDYFDELLERIRDIRASERRFYQKILDIYSTSVDYKPDVQLSQEFFATVQNKMHWATHGHTAAEVVFERADSSKPLMAGARAKADDDAGLGRQAGRVPQGFRPETARSRREDIGRGRAGKGRSGIRALQRGTRFQAARDRRGI
jgi:hypothetical protein